MLFGFPDLYDFSFSFLGIFRIFQNVRNSQNAQNSLEVLGGEQVLFENGNGSFFVPQNLKKMFLLSPRDTPNP